ncbi:unnamed protein product [Polarella glacialis]|uniref:VOC domain-containing protein n=1 Tax=Polarella glacialis TaxID=89957 RepID=A0A813ESG4_POLGL|nr:unnamed protein product [Polarella glacialis]
MADSPPAQLGEAAGAGSSSFFTDAGGQELLAALPSLHVPQVSHPALLGARVLVVGGSIGGLAAAACLRAAGFQKVQVLERSAPGAQPPGAGVGLDDATMAILKGLGVPCWAAVGSSAAAATSKSASKAMVVQPMRWTEERLACGRVLLRQPFPYFAALYAELRVALTELLPAGTVVSGHKATRLERLPDGTLRVHCAEGLPVECDLCICADGPRSAFRRDVLGDGVSDEMRFAGYAAWRGTAREAALPPALRDAFRAAFPHFSNCLYFVMCEEPRQSCVVYDIGDGLWNWLIYENRSQPVAETGRTTSAPEPEDIARLRANARSHWGEALGGLIEVTEDPFWTDIYDIQTPLKAFHPRRTTGGDDISNVALLGDAAHPTTPHMAKGSNMALHDAFALAAAAASATSLPDMLEAYSASRAQECARTVLLSRHLGRLRNGLLPLPASVAASVMGVSSVPLLQPQPATAAALLAQVREAGLPTRTLPVGGAFQEVWQLVEEKLPREVQRGFFLEQPGPLSITMVNHISRETCDVERLASFYREVLGLAQIPRPDFGFGGAWFQLPGGGKSTTLHIIQRDPQKPSAAAGETLQDAADLLGAGCRAPERFIRRSHHLALTVQDIEAAKRGLTAHGIGYAVNAVPGTQVVQLFVYDPDGNGIEIGNFDVSRL